MFRGPDHMASRKGCCAENRSGIVEDIRWKAADRVSLVKRIRTAKIPGRRIIENEPYGWPTGSRQRRFHEA
jgi:hypothetical protein